MIKITNDTRIGWIGTGVMGEPMCGHLLDAGHPVTVYNRTMAKAGALIERGAIRANSPRAVAEESEVVFTIVGFPDDVRQVYFGDGGILAGMRRETVTIDMTTTEPSLARKIAETAAGKGVHAIDAPVSGGDVGARNAALSIMVGGDNAVVGAVMPLLQRLGKNVVHQGPPGAGQHTKMCNQIVIASTMIGVCESLIYATEAGLDLDTMLKSISGGAAACWTLDNLAPRIVKRKFDAGFFVEHFVKDMGIALSEANRMNLSLPGLTLVHRLYTEAMNQGHGRLGTHALMLALEQLLRESN